MSNDFETEREANIARNRAMLAALDIQESYEVVKRTIQPKVAKPKATKSKKRKEVPADENVDEEAQPPRKVAPVATETGGPRRSGRNAGKKVDYSGDGDHIARNDGPRVISNAARAAEEGVEARSVMQRTQNPKTYGSIPGVPVGSWWKTREECSKDAIHAPWVAGIAPGPEGCYSVALSGGYEDDIDLGEGFTYTGSGGRDLKGTKQNPKNLRTAPQTFDQSFETRDNQSLMRSMETQKPIRVIRGYKLHSRYAPTEGYRYDGLYTVEKAWMETGLNKGGFKVCKFALKRIPGQPRLPVYEDSEEPADETAEDAAEETTEDAAEETTEEAAPSESAMDTLTDSQGSPEAESD